MPRSLEMVVVLRKHRPLPEPVAPAIQVVPVNPPGPDLPPPQPNPPGPQVPGPMQPPQGGDQQWKLGVMPRLLRW